MGPGRPPFDMSDFPSQEEIDGPPTPGTFKQLLSLTDQQTEQYTRSWDSLMAATTAERDSARAARDAMRSAFRQHDRDGAQEQAKVLSRIGKDLKKRDEAFDKSLGFLSKDQHKQYEDYKKEQQKAREDERRRRFGGESGAGPPGSS
jgi:acyl-CoA reductase-like NAD-dependent aldehyde dehydrogenase